MNLGSIPARAGEPDNPPARCSPIRVYPRACGGTTSRRSPTRPSLGLSPRVRGNLVIVPRPVTIVGSIPARAGEPSRRRRVSCPNPVYPRRVRGNRRGAPARRSGSGSIPARAGEPSSGRACERRCRVYPRACGGTCTRRYHTASISGLSPRVRGNHITPEARIIDLRSIPARAGEPVRHRTQRLITAVYPRACGGTRLDRIRPAGTNGLSPRVRGNRRLELERLLVRRSIPARAGEPPSGRQRQSRAAVYPRACGGTSPAPTSGTCSAGLSPRVRGNPHLVGCGGGYVGSIPARAGEPSCLSGGDLRPAVYPRACGGTSSSWCSCSQPRGLSPRVRGNPVPRAWGVPRDGSIPARAGEPTSSVRTVAG